jgi:hypothetical protein
LDKFFRLITNDILKSLDRCFQVVFYTFRERLFDCIIVAYNWRISHSKTYRRFKKLPITKFRFCPLFLTANTKFIFVSWDFRRQGLWYGIEVFGTRSQFKTTERTWSKGIGKGESKTTYTTINYENVQEVGSKLYFDSLNRRPYYFVILAMGTLADCMSGLK